MVNLEWNSFLGEYNTSSRCILPIWEFVLGNRLFTLISFSLLGLETVDRFPILGAVTGILLTLLMEGTIERFVSKLQKLFIPKRAQKSQIFISQKTTKLTASLQRTAGKFPLEWSLTRISIIPIIFRTPFTYVQHNSQYHLKVLLNSFHLIGYTLGFHLNVRTTLYSIINSTT